VINILPERYKVVLYPPEAQDQKSSRLSEVYSSSDRKHPYTITYLSHSLHIHPSIHTFTHYTHQTSSLHSYHNAYHQIPRSSRPGRPCHGRAPKDGVSSPPFSSTSTATHTDLLLLYRAGPKVSPIIEIVQTTVYQGDSTVTTLNAPLVTDAPDFEDYWLEGNWLAARDWRDTRDAAISRGREAGARGRRKGAAGRDRGRAQGAAGRDRGRANARQRNGAIPEVDDDVPEHNWHDDVAEAKSTASSARDYASSVVSSAHDTASSVAAEWKKDNHNAASNDTDANEDGDDDEHHQAVAMTSTVVETTNSTNTTQALELKTDNHNAASNDTEVTEAVEVKADSHNDAVNTTDLIEFVEMRDILEYVANAPLAGEMSAAEYPRMTIVGTVAGGIVLVAAAFALL